MRLTVPLLLYEASQGYTPLKRASSSLQLYSKRNRQIAPKTTAVRMGFREGLITVSSTIARYRAYTVNMSKYYTYLLGS